MAACSSCLLKCSVDTHKSNPVHHIAVTNRYNLTSRLVRSDPMDKYTNVGMASNSVLFSGCGQELKEEAL